MVGATERIEAAIDKLADISSDLKAMIAVQETRLSQHEKQAEVIEIKLEKRREELDTKLKDVYENYAGKSVAEIKDILINEFKKNGISDSMWETTAKVVCRCTTTCHVKILENQWFLNIPKCVDL